MLFDNLVSAVIIGVTFVVLLVESVYHATKLNGKLAPIGIVVQLFLCAVRAATLVVQMTVPNLHCVLLGMFGMGVYAFWISALDCILLLRSSVFLTFIANSFVKKVFVCVCSVEIAFSLLNQLYVASTATNSNGNAPYCDINANFAPETYTLVNRCVLYILFSIPFAYKAYESFTSHIMPKEEARMWTRIGLNNAFFTILIIVMELISARATQISFLQPWLTLFFACNNFFEANIVLLILDDTKKQLVKANSSKSDPSSRVTETQSNIRLDTKSYNSGKYTHNPQVF
ncbi:hypothetical protein HDV06_003882 [Boothiomyces sp. JEL0866]|nr:hypothetical protein HDV06_003882 [Boothiomyces sp. JEL0866]